jgi:molybdopterin/thiamine biosynthesis adenylyltransferase
VRTDLDPSTSRVVVEPHNTMLRKDNALALLRGYHVVVDCTDNVVSRYLLRLVEETMRVNFTFMS